VLLLGAALAFVLSAVVSLVLLLLRRVTLKSTLPFGPFMLLGAFTAVLLS
jgi:leader peptidase (prepilin peptidase) / N-methyltransferase